MKSVRQKKLDVIWSHESRGRSITDPIHKIKQLRKELGDFNRTQITDSLGNVWVISKSSKNGDYLIDDGTYYNVKKT